MSDTLLFLLENNCFCCWQGCLRNRHFRCVAITPSLCSRVTVLRHCAHGASRCSFQAVIVLTVRRGVPTSSPAPSAQGGSRKLGQFKPSLCSRCSFIVLAVRHGVPFKLSLCSRCVAVLLQAHSRKSGEFKPSLCSRCVTLLLQAHPPHQHRVAHKSSGKLVGA